MYSVRFDLANSPREREKLKEKREWKNKRERLCGDKIEKDREKNEAYRDLQLHKNSETELL